jgi:hypothetical protein
MLSIFKVSDGLIVPQSLAKQIKVGCLAKTKYSIVTLASQGHFSKAIHKLSMNPYIILLQILCWM